MHPHSTISLLAFLALVGCQTTPTPHHTALPPSNPNATSNKTAVHTPDADATTLAARKRTLMQKLKSAAIFGTLGGAQGTPPQNFLSSKSTDEKESVGGMIGAYTTKPTNSSLYGLGGISARKTVPRTSIHIKWTDVLVHPTQGSYTSAEVFKMLRRSQFRMRHCVRKKIEASPVSEHSEYTVKFAIRGASAHDIKTSSDDSSQILNACIRKNLQAMRYTKPSPKGETQEVSAKLVVYILQKTAQPPNGTLKMIQGRKKSTPTRSPSAPK